MPYISQTLNIHGKTVYRMLNLSQESDKKSAFEIVQRYILSNGLNILNKDEKRPWGGFFVIDDTSLITFINHFFPGIDVKKGGEDQALSPKILLVQPEKRLSWQYHHRRSEVWRIVDGPVGIILSDDDEQTPIQPFAPGDVITIEQGQRHRLVGLQGWGVIAEIWQHTDTSNPSDEHDIVRVEDDFGR